MAAACRGGGTPRAASALSEAQSGSGRLWVDEICAFRNRLPGICPQLELQADVARAIAEDASTGWIGEHCVSETVNKVWSGGGFAERGNQV